MERWEYEFGSDSESSKEKRRITLNQRADKRGTKIMRRGDLVYMDPVIPDLPFVASMFVGMLICLEIGRRLGIRSLLKDPQGAMSGLGVMQGAVFSLYGLLIAFTFSGAPARFDARRHLVVEEADKIGTAYLRLDLLAPEAQTMLREQFRKYLDSRLQAFRKLPDYQGALPELAKSEKLQMAIWKGAVVACRLPRSSPGADKLVLPALNEMIDITAMRTMAMKIHPPLVIFELLFFLALICSLLAGYGMAASKHRSWLHIMAFAFVAVISVFVILEIEYPRTGIWKLHTTNFWSTYARA